MTLGWEVKAAFFDREKVKKAMDRATRRNMSKFGAFTRQRAKTSIRKRKGVSAPGNPPHSHVGLLRKGIFFSFDATARSVVIGPVLLRGRSGGNESVPRLLEEGGRVRRRNQSRGRGRRRARKTAVYRPRPYMGPAFEETKRELGPIWRDSVR